MDEARATVADHVGDVLIHDVVADVATGIGAVLRRLADRDERVLDRVEREQRRALGGPVGVDRLRDAHDAAVVGDAARHLAGVLQVVRGVLERDRVAALAEADHDVGRAARDRVGDLVGRAVVLDRQHEPHDARARHARGIERGHRDAGHVVVPAIRGERLEAGDEHAGRARAFERARRRRAAQLDARGIGTGVDVELRDVAAIGKQIADADVEHRAQRGGRARREAAIDQIGEPRVDRHAVDGDRVDRAAALRQLDHEVRRVVGDARAGRDREPEVLGEHLDIVELDLRAALGRELDRHRRAGAGPRDREIDERGLVAQAIDRERVGGEHVRRRRVAHGDRQDRSGGRVRGDAQVHVDRELALLRAAGEARGARGREHAAAAQRLGRHDLRAQRMTGAVELAVDEVAQQAGVRVGGSRRGRRAADEHHGEEGKATHGHPRSSPRASASGRTTACTTGYSSCQAGVVLRSTVSSARRGGRRGRRA